MAILRAFGDPPSASSCLVVRLAASNRNYGTVRFRVRKSCERWAWNGIDVFKRGGHNHWHEVAAGSAYHCPLEKIPRRVQRDLDVCP